MQRIGDLQTYVKLSHNQDAIFIQPQALDQARQIKMRFLSEGAANAYLVPIFYDHEAQKIVEIHDDPDFTRFLCHLAGGLDQIEFYWKGSFALRLVGAQAWLDTYDNTAFNVEAADPLSFARLWEREEVDPRILEMERAARHNQMLLKQQMAADMAAMRQEMEARYVASNPSPAPASNDGNASAAPDDQSNDQSNSGANNAGQKNDG
jgi:hypothetical protein